MAAPSNTVWGSISNSKGKLGIAISASNTNTQTTLTVEVWLAVKYNISDSSNKYYFSYTNDSGSTVTSPNGTSLNLDFGTTSGSGWGTSSQKQIGKYTLTYTRGTSSKTVKFTAKLNDLASDNYDVSVSTSYTIPTLPSYTITYNANGGTGAPSNQTKYYGKNITVSTTKPTLFGYTFVGWSTAKDDTVEYNSGSAFGLNANTTLYAVWRANTYTITYNANGGTGEPSSQTKTHDVALTLSSTIPTRTNYNFKGWSTTSTGGVAYSSGGTYTANTAVTLYAVWELAYTIPRVSGFTVNRCLTNGTIDENGKNIKVAFTWATDKTISSIKVEWKANNASTWTSSTISASGASGTVNSVVGSNAIDPEKALTVKVTVADSLGSKVVSTTLNGTLFPIDILYNGDGVAFGKAAELSGVLDSNFLALFRKGYKCYPTTNTISSTTNDTVANWDALGNSVHYYNTTGCLIDQPNQYGVLLNFTNNQKNIHQFWLSQPSGNVYHRGGNANGWSKTWQAFVDSNNVASYALPITGGTVSGVGNITGGGSTVGSYRFNPAWLGLYTNNADAQANTNRQGYMGHDGGKNLLIKNEVSDGRFRFITSSNFYLDYYGHKYSDNWTGGFFSPSDAGGTALGTTNSRWYRSYVVNAESTSSDRRLKHDINYISDLPVTYRSGENILEQLFNNLKPSTYIMNADSKERINIGFIAQDVVEALEAVGFSENDLDLVNHYNWIDKETGEEKEEYGMVYSQFIALNTHMIQKQQSRINELENEVSELKELVNQLLNKGGQ